MNKNYLFKSYYEGVGKTSKKSFRMLELHDIESLENTQFFIPEGKELSILSTLKFKDVIEVEHGVAVFNGKANMTVEKITYSKAKF